MRKLKILLVALVTVISTTAFANTIIGEGTSLEVIEGNNHIYQVKYNQSGNQKITLTLKDKANFTIYTENIQSSDGFNKYLDLSKLPTGNYQINLALEDRVIQREIEILDAVKKYEDVLFIRDIEDGKVHIYASEKLDKKLTVVVKGAADKAIYKEDIDLSKGCVFNFSQVVGEKVTLLIYEENEFVKEKIVALN